MNERFFLSLLSDPFQVRPRRLYRCQTSCLTRRPGEDEARICSKRKKTGKKSPIILGLCAGVWIFIGVSPLSYEYP